MRISDWSSDVCSSDLLQDIEDDRAGDEGSYGRHTQLREFDDRAERPADQGCPRQDPAAASGKQVLVIMLKGHIVDHEVQRHGHGVPDQFQRLAGITVGEDMADQCVVRSEEHTSALQSLMRTASAVFCWKKK